MRSEVEKMAKRDKKKLPKIKPINNFLMLFIISVFQLVTAFSAAYSYEKFESKVLLAAALLILTEWI